MDKKFRILVCPLNWGLGHATRMIPVINQLIDNNFAIIIAADGAALDFLKKEFPNLKSIQISHYKITYSKGNSQVFRMARLFPSIVYYTIKEHVVLKEIIKQEKIDCVISDNRYGLYNKSIYSVFVTHQLNILFPRFLKILEPLVRSLVRTLIKKYNECWIPDFEGDLNLSGSFRIILIIQTYFILVRYLDFKKPETSIKRNMIVLSYYQGLNHSERYLNKRFMDNCH
jgi:hypothetical protein